MRVAEDPVLHECSGPATRWSTVNMAEVMPGVLSPLAWSFWRDPAEAGLRKAFADAGLLARREVPPPESLDRRLTGLFYGRYAGNLSFICELCDRMPGSSGESFEQQMFGYADPDVERRRSYGRYPVVAIRMPTGVALLRRRLARTRAETHAWWARVTAPGATASSRERLEEARAMLSRALRIHMFCSLVAQGCYEQVTGLAAAAGRPGSQLELTGGYGGMEELRVSSDLWEVSRGRLGMDEFVARHGYHGPAEGELSSRSWREDRTPVETLAATYSNRPDREDPRARERERAAVRVAAEAALLQTLPLPRRARARAVLRAAATFLPLREVGKAAFLQTIDAGRAAAREIGAALASSGTIEHPDDVFMLTIGELDGGVDGEAGALVEHRRELRRRYQGLRLPERWTGEPEALPVARTVPESAIVEGVPVSGGTVEGRARIVRDPSQARDFEPGDVLVCETTDPSWVVLFQLAAGVVIDVGGPLSHGAIVARELGIPAVINTRSGTSVIPDGSRVRVDGSSGRVEVLQKP
jgi:phosphohistidine swiveling domain-containing protein